MSIPSEVTVLVNDLVELGGLVRRRRTEQGLSQTELAEKVGTTRQWVSRLEQGKNDIGITRLLCVFDALELNLDIRPPRLGGSTKAYDVDAPSLIPSATVSALAQMARDRLRHETGSSARVAPGSGMISDSSPLPTDAGAAGARDAQDPGRGDAEP